jgi:hypothetical protein
MYQPHLCCISPSVCRWGVISMTTPRSTSPAPLPTRWLTSELSRKEGRHHAVHDYPHCTVQCTAILILYLATLRLYCTVHGSPHTVYLAVFIVYRDIVILYLVTLRLYMAILILLLAILRLWCAWLSSFLYLAFLIVYRDILILYLAILRLEMAILILYLAILILCLAVRILYPAILIVNVVTLIL